MVSGHSIATLKPADSRLVKLVLAAMVLAIFVSAYMFVTPHDDPIPHGVTTKGRIAQITIAIMQYKSHHYRYPCRNRIDPTRPVRISLDNEINAIANLLENPYCDSPNPEENHALDPSAPYVPRDFPLTDGWGEPLIYFAFDRKSPQGFDYLLFSLGPKGAKNRQDMLDILNGKTPEDIAATKGVISNMR